MGRIRVGGGGLCENMGSEEGCIRKGMGAGMRKVRNREEFGNEREKCVKERGRSFIGRVRTVCRGGRSLGER